MKQQWQDLLFLHWEIPIDEILPYIPSPLEPDLYEGKAYIGLVPFFMHGLTGRYCPTISSLSNFPEFNVRTYVTYKGKPGVFFLSLDVSNKVAVWIANKMFRLPYRHASLNCDRQGKDIHYHSQFSPSEEFEIVYQKGSRLTLEKDSFLSWATERYCLYTSHHERLIRGEIHHPAWELFDASYELLKNSMLDRFNIGASQPVAFSPQMDVVVYPMEWV